MDITKRNDKLQRVFRPPQSGQIIGVMVKSLGVSNDVFSSKTARRYFSGKRIHDELALEIMDELASTLIDTGMFPLPDKRGSDDKYKKLLSLVVQRCAIRWDQIAGYMRSASFPVNKMKLAPLPYLRLAAIDLSLRAAGILRINGIQNVGNEVPYWAEKGGNVRFINSLLKGLGEKRPTRERIARFTGVSDNTVDSWIDAGARPSDKHLRKLSEVLGSASSDAPAFSEDGLLGTMRRHYLLSSLCDNLTTYVDRPAVLDLAEAWVRFTNRLLELLKGYNQSAAPGDALILALGTEFESSTDLLEPLWRAELDPAWRADLFAAPGDWIPRLQTTAQSIGSIDGAMEEFRKQFAVSDEIMKDIAKGIDRLILADPTRAMPPRPGETRFVIHGDAAFSARNRMTQAIQASSEGDFDSAITHLRRAVELQPQSPMYHFHLGANLGKRGFIEEAIKECWIASKLDPKWDIPIVEVGIILMNAGQNQAALDHMEKVVKAFPELTTHLAANLGYARMRCNDPQGALAMFEIVIKDQPDHGIVLDCAAHCYFLTGNDKNGRAFAKRANQLGFGNTYRDWRAGKYRGKAGLDEE